MTEQVERVAKIVYERGMRYLRLDVPEWTEGGNSLAQDEARAAASEIIAAMRKDAAMDRLVAEGQRCDAMTPQEGRSLPDRVMVWHSSPTLSHLGTWATTRYPEDAVAYVPEAAEMQPTVLDGTSPRAVIGEIGNQIHNLACEFQGNEDLAERLEHFACKLWRTAQTASLAPMPTVTPQEAAKVLWDMLQLSDGIPKIDQDAAQALWDRVQAAGGFYPVKEFLAELAGIDTGEDSHE